MMSRHWFGLSRYNRLKIMVLMATDLPEPVVPAINRCGMRARSTITGSPPMVVPRQSGNFELLAQIDLLAGRIGQLDADHVASCDHGDARRERAHGAGDIVGEADHARGFDARRRLQLVKRAGRARPGIEDISART